MLKVGIIGSGFGLYGLLPAFNAIKDCRVACICGKKTNRLLKYCQKIHLDNIYTDWKQMMQNEGLDAVALAVPPKIQYQIAKIAIKKNINVFAEKPLTINCRQAVELYRLAVEKKVVHAVDFIFPEIKAWQVVKKLLDKNKYGKLKHVSVNWNFLSYDLRKNISSWKTDIKEGGGALSFFFSHTLYYLEYYAGEIVNLQSSLSYSKESKNGAEVGVDLLLKFKNLMTGDAHIYINDKGLNRHQLTFICEKGTIVLENNSNAINNFTVQVLTGKNTKVLFVKKEKPIINSYDGRVVLVKKIAGRFIKACVDRTPVLPSFSQGLRVQRLIERIREKSI